MMMKGIFSGQELKKSLETKEVDWLIFTTCQPINGYFMPTLEEITFIVRYYSLFLPVFFKTFFYSQLFDIKYSNILHIINIHL